MAAGLVLALAPSFGAEWAWSAWLCFCAGLACLIGVDVIFAPTARAWGLELSAPETIFIGEPASAQLELKFQGASTLPVVALIDLSPSLHPAPVFRGAVPPEGLTLTIPLEARRRGTARIESAWIEYPGPLGLASRRLRFDLNRNVAVVPNVMPARRIALRLAQDRHFYAGLKIERYRGDGSEFESLRDFTVGDELRSVHWRASARHRKVLSQQFRAERNHQVVIALDRGRLMSESFAGDVPKLDQAVAAALVLAFVSIKSGDRCGLFDFADRVGGWVKPQSGMGAFRALQRQSAALEYTSAETNFTLGLTSLLRRLSRRSLVVVLTDFVDSIAAELMIENLGRLARKHLVVFVTLRDPQIESWIHAAPTDTLTLNRAVAAADDRREREVVLRRLERLGLQTIDVEPHRIGPELINRYLEIKRRERI